MNIHIAHDKKVFDTLRQGEKKLWNIHSLSLALTQTLTLTAILSPQLRKTMHTIPPNEYRTYLSYERKIASQHA